MTTVYDERNICEHSIWAMDLPAAFDSVSDWVEANEGFFTVRSVEVRQKDPEDEGTPWIAIIRYKED